MQLIWSTTAGWLVFSAWPDAMTLLGAAIIIGSGFYTAVGERPRGGGGHRSRREAERGSGGAAPGGVEGQRPSPSS
jgi:hypothetical protein